MTTQRQTECLGHIREIIAGGESPSLEDLRVRMDVKSRGNIIRYLTALEECGLVRRRRHRARSIELVEPRLPTAAEMSVMPLSTLERHLGELSGLLAHKAGPSHLRSLFDRIGARLAGRRAA